MVSYAKYSLVPTDEPDKTGGGTSSTQSTPKKAVDGGPGLLNNINIFNPTHKPPSANKSTLPPPPNSAFDYTSAFNFKSAFDYNSGCPSQYQSAFDYGYSHRKDTAGLNATAGSGKNGAYCLVLARLPSPQTVDAISVMRELLLFVYVN